MSESCEGYLERSREKLRRMGVPFVVRPEDIEDIINAPSENIGALKSMDAANSMQYKISQMILFVNQEYNITKSSYNEAAERLNQKLHRATSQVVPKSMTLKEKAAKVLEEDQELSQMNDCVMELKQRLELLEGWCDHLKNLHDVAKQVYYRLKAEEFPYS